MKVSEVQQFIEPHKTVFQFLSSLYGIPSSLLERHLTERLERGDSVLARRLRETSDDETQAKLLALGGVLSAEPYLKGSQESPPHPPAQIAFRIESLTSPLLRDTLYSRYWLGYEVEEISRSQRIRVITVQQNLKRALKQAFSTERLAVETLSGWRSRGAERDACGVSEDSLVEALFSPSLADKLPPPAQEALVDALCGAAREMASENILVVGPRSLRIEKGQAWVEPERRPGALERAGAGIPVSESISVYDSERVYSVSHPEQNWSLRLVHRREGMEVVWQEGGAPVVVRGPSGEILGICGESTRRVIVPSYQPPLRISLRPTQQEP